MKKSMWLFFDIALVLLLILAAGKEALARAQYGAQSVADLQSSRQNSGLVVGVPHESLWNTSNQFQGGVHVLYSTSTGLTTQDNQWIDRNDPGIPASALPADWFGWALTTGDFNGDGFTDVAIGVPGADTPGYQNLGAVVILYNSPTGINTADSQWLDRSKASIYGTPQDNLYFGISLASGDFNGDGYDDLAVGAPYSDTPNNKPDAGDVSVFYGSSRGLRVSVGWISSVYQDMLGRKSEVRDGFGTSLVVGDFNGDGNDDLAVGAPYEDVGDIVDAGEVDVIYGSRFGLTNRGVQWYTQNSANIAGHAEARDRFGFALAAGNFGENDCDDLVIGVPFEDKGSISEAGMIHVLEGSPLGLSDEYWFDQNTPGIHSQAESHDQFGYALAAGDFDGDGIDDLAVGVPGEGLGNVSGAGEVDVLYGRPAGLFALDSRWFNQGMPGIHGRPEAGDHFGRTLAAGDVNGDGIDDLAVGVPDEDIGNVDNAGGVTMLYGTSSGISFIGSQWLKQGASGLPEHPDAKDHFGFSLAIWQSAKPYPSYLPAMMNR